jgi:hypothetical protein
MRRLVLALGCVAVLAGCGSSAEDGYSVADVKAAYYKQHDGGAGTFGSWVDPDDHSHTDYVPPGAVEVCPLAQRANYNGTTVPHVIEPEAAQPVPQFAVVPQSPDDLRTPSVTQGALVFGTSKIASTDMDRVTAAMARCPANYEVRGGPSTILGTYNATSRPVDADGWKGVAQQVAHTFPDDDVYYEDLTHVVVHRANVILYLDVTHRKIIGERSDSAATAEGVLKTVLKRLG